MIEPLFANISLSAIALAITAVACASAPLTAKLPASPTSVKAPLANKQANSSPLASLEQSVLSQVNQYRASKNLSPLVMDERISAQARAHSQAMASGQVPFSHQGFDKRIQAISKVIPLRAAAENVAYNQGYSDPDAQAVKGWINSTGHRQNMEGQYNLTGIGVAKNDKGEYYFTQIFIRSR